jgi:hypothetical protein
MRAVHAGRLERWLGTEADVISRNMRGWYGGPIPVGMPGTTGLLYAMPDGDFRGTLRAGEFASYRDYQWDALTRAIRRAARRALSQPNMGFSSLSDLISEATTGAKRQDVLISKLGTFTTTAFSASLWNVGNSPLAGGAVTAIPGGEAPTNATAGAMSVTNAAGGDTLHVVSGWMQASSAPNTLLIYDRIFHAGSVLHTTTGNQAVSGVPTRHATTTSPKNFCFLEITGQLGTTAHNATITYTDTVPNAAEAGAATVVTTSSVVTRIPFPLWYYPLNTGDLGLRTVTNIAFSAVSTGTSAVVMGHPLIFLPCPVANIMMPFDGINSMFNLVKILDGACLAMIEMKGVGSASTYTGQLVLVSG